MATPLTTTAGRVSLPALVSRVPEPVRLAALALVFLGVELVVGASIVEARLGRLLMLVVGLGALALVFRFPMATMIALLGLTDFIFHAGFFPSFGVGPISVDGFELALGALFVVAVVRPQRRSWGGLAGAALAAFLVLVAVSGLAAVEAGRAELTDVIAWGRALALLTVFYVVVRVFPDASQRRTLLTAAAVLAAITGLVALMVALGAGLGDMLKDAGSQIIREEEGVGGIQRVRLVGLSAGYALFWYSAMQVQCARGWNRAGWSAVLAGISLNILVSFNRNMWSGLIIGLALILLLGGPMVRSRVVAALAVGAAGIALITAVSPSGQDRLIDPVIKRGSTIINPSEISREGSYKDRELETEAAWEVAKQHLALGVGAGAPIGVWFDDRIGEQSYVRIPQLFLHNQYLYLLLIAGIPGLLAFLAFLATPVFKAFRRVPRDLPITSLAIGIVLIMISSFVAIYFTVGDMTVVLGLLTGAIIADSETRAADGQPSGLGT